VNPPAPTLTSITPAAGVQGAAVPVTLTGTNFVAGTIIGVANGGISVTGVTVVSLTQITATLNIAAGATLGPANVTATTAGGASNSVVFTVNRVACPASSTMQTLLDLGANGCQWGSANFYSFSYNYLDYANPATSLPASAVTVQFSGDLLAPVVSFRGNWSVTAGNQANLTITYWVRAPGTNPMIASSVSLTGQVSNVDPDNQFSSMVSDAGSASWSGNPSMVQLGANLNPPDTASGPVTVTDSSSASYPAAQTNVNIVHGIALISTAPDPSVGIQQSNPASVSRLDNGLTLRQ
jgi:hypothetical protein